MSFYMREIEVMLEDKTIRHPNIDIEFEVNFSDDSEGNTGYIDLYNLSPQTINQIEEGSQIVLSAGYRGNVGQLLPAVAESVYTRPDGVDKKTEIIIGDHTDAWLNMSINRTWAAGKSAETIARDIIDILPFDLGEFNPAKNVTYENGKTFTETCKTALEELAIDTATKLHVARGQIFFRPLQKGAEEVILLNSSTGLIGSPERGEKDGQVIYDVKCLLNYKIWADEVIRIESDVITGEFRVIDGRHFRSGDEMLTEMEVVRYAA